MHRLWDSVIAPILEAATPSTILEIGSETGRCTQLLLQFAKEHHATVYAVDPFPQFSVEDWEKEHAPYFHCIKEYSVHAIPKLPLVDVALIDGDHNWYTVFHELTLLDSASTQRGYFPVTILHDTGWPYGRRDMYYHPSSIPKDYRKPMEKNGILPHQSSLTSFGINAQLCHSTEEGTQQNGVLTAIEDFLSTTTFPLEFFELPGMHGLGILIDQSLRTTHPQLFELLRQLCYSDVQKRHIQTLESARIQEYIARQRAQQIQVGLSRELTALRQCIASELQHTTRGVFHKQNRIAQEHHAVTQLMVAYIRLNTQLRTKHICDAADIHQQYAHQQHYIQRNRTELSRMVDALRSTRQHSFTLTRTRSWRWTQWIRTLESYIRNVPHILHRYIHRTPYESLPSPHAHCIDILIPIHNAPWETQYCIESVLQNTDYPHRIVLLNDGSTHPDLCRYLEDITIQHQDRILLLHTETARGFVQTVNRGLSLSENDVVVLNSDTIVPPHWLSRLVETAYSTTDIASVTPLSNTSSIYSVLQDRLWLPFPHQSDVTHIDNVLQNNTKRYRPTIPTGVGFCFYMRREALHRTGLFDEQFGIGYGEENDWCMRASSQGFHHLLDDTLFVYHKGGASMLEAGHIAHAHSGSPEHEALLHKRHPHYTKLISHFLRKDTTLPEIRSTLHEAIERQHHEKPHIVYLLHQHPSSPDALLGGVAWHVIDLLTELHEHVNFTLLYPLKKSIGIIQIINGTTRTSDFHRKHGSDSTIFRYILSAIQPDLVHIHHAMGTTYALCSVAKELNIPVIYSIHDFHALDPSITLLDAQGEYRGVPSDTASCIHLPEHTYKSWRHAVREHLQAAHTILAPSQSALTIYDTVYGDLPAHRHIIEHGYGTQKTPATPSGNPYTYELCILGLTSGNHKGKTALEELVHHLVYYGKSIAFLGSNADEFPSLRSLSHVHFFGRYNREDVLPTLQNIHPKAVLLLSSWPETYCYTLTEAWAAGIPVFVSPRGALEERVRSCGAGKVATTETPKDMAREIVTWLDSEEYTKAASHVRSLKIKTRSDMAREYYHLYRTIRSRTTHPQTLNNAPASILAIIPTSGKELLRIQQCIEALLHAAKGVLVRIVVVHSPATKPEQEHLEQALQNVDTVLARATFNYPASLNAGLSLRNHEDYVLFLNDDCFFQESNDLSSLLQTLHKKHWSAIAPWVEEEYPDSDRTTGPSRSAGPLSLHSPLPGMCMLWKSEWIEKIGLFEEQFGKGYGCDEADYFLRARNIGARWGRDDSIAVRHINHATFGKQAAISSPEHQKNLRTWNIIHRGIHPWGQSRHWIPLPGIHVAVAGHNVSPWIQRALDSIETSLHGYSWILSYADDASTDTSYRIVQQHHSSADHVLLRSYPKARGAAEAKNRTIGLGLPFRKMYPILCCMDSDDIMLPERIQWLLPAMINHGYTALFGDYITESLKGETLFHPASEVLRTHGEWLHPCSTLLHTSCIPDTGVLFAPDMTKREDEHLWRRWAQSGVILHPYPGKPVHIHCEREGSVMRPHSPTGSYTSITSSRSGIRTSSSARV